MKKLLAISSLIWLAYPSMNGQIKFKEVMQKNMITVIPRIYILKWWGIIGEVVDLEGM